MKNKKNIEDIYPLSDNQVTFLLNHISSGDKDSGQILVKCKFQGYLDKETFIRAWHAVIKKHGSLRSSIHWNKLSKPLQVVYKDSEPDIVFLGEPPADSKVRIPLAIDRQPNHLISVFSENDDEHIVYWNCHHIFIDGWSTSIVLDQFTDIYNTLVKTGRIAATASRSIQFKDYLDWLKTRDMDEARAHWLNCSKTRLNQSGESSVLSAKDADIANQEQARLEPQTRALIRELSIQTGATLSEIVQSSWAIYLALLSQSGQTAFVLTLSGRSSPMAGIESLVGQLTTALPVHLQLTIHDNLLSVINKVRTENNTLRKYDYLSLLQLYKWGYHLDNLPQVRINKKLHSVVSLVVVENFATPSAAQRFDEGLELVSFESGIVSNYPLTLIALTDHNDVTLKMLASDSVFDGAVTRQMFDSFTTLFAHLLKCPDQVISQYRHLVKSQAAVTSDLPAAISEHTRFEIKNRGEYKPPQSDIEDHLQKIWQDIFATDNKISIDENYFDLGGTSLNVITLYARIESRFNCKLPISTILEAPTIEKLAALITQRPDECSQIIVPVQTRGERLPIFGIHAQDILFYRDISNALGNQQPFYAIQQLEYDNIADYGHSDFPQLAATYIDEIKKIQERGPYTIMGLCMGCTIGYEIVNQLFEAGDRINVLILFDPDLPEMVFRKKPPGNLSLMTAINADSFKHLITRSTRALLKLPLIYRLALLKGRMRIARKSLTGPLEKRRAIRRHYNWKLNQKYSPCHYNGKIRVIQSGQYYQSMNRYFYNRPDDFDLNANVQTAIIEGTHTSIFSPPKVYETTELINQYIQHK